MDPFPVPANPHLDQHIHQIRFITLAKPSQLLFTPQYTQLLPLDIPVVTCWGWILPVVGLVPLW
jgi:hypothetical protein